jgi:23S rRNA maturation-related 3'-5' exoribonuclease YhaM
MWAELEELVDHVQDGHIRELLKRITVRHGEKLRIWPAAQTVHHAYRGGFSRTRSQRHPLGAHALAPLTAPARIC